MKSKLICICHTKNQLEVQTLRQLAPLVHRMPSKKISCAPVSHFLRIVFFFVRTVFFPSAASKKPLCPAAGLLSLSNPAVTT